MVILVTGGCGRIGKPLVRKLLKNGEKVKILMCKPKKIKEHKNLEIYYGNILDEKSLEKAMGDVDVVYHLAAILDYNAPKKMMREINVEGTRNLLKAAHGKRIIFMSSTAVMGKKLQKIPANEKTYCKPTNVYGQTKLDAERLVAKIGGIIIRAPPVYGKGFEKGYFDIFDQIKSGEMYIIGDGSNRIHHIHINDLVDALILAKDNGKVGETYIVAGDDVRTQEEVLKITAEKLGIEFVRKQISLDVAKFLAKVKNIKSQVAGREKLPINEYIDVLASDRVFDISKAKRDLGFIPKIHYDQGLDEILITYRKKKSK
jgi:nucleoside-diphosphate-sugar epimerase